MVARRFDTKTAFDAPLAFLLELLEMWRRLLTTWRDALHRVFLRLTPAEKPGAALRPWLLRRTVIWLGGGALALGVALGVALAPPGVERSVAILAGAQSLLWALVRWLLMRYVSRSAVRDSAVLLGASSLGLLAYAAAVTPELRVAAWAGSAALTWLAFVRLGEDRSEASRTVGIAWGSQALVVAASWIARNGVLAFLASRG